MGLTKETRVIRAHHPRQNDWCTVSPEDILDVVYNVYDHDKNRTKPKSNHPPNLVFVHGTGMCKELWEDMIERFYENYPEQLGMVISLDNVAHNDSAQLNADKLGWVQPWSDGARDIVRILEEVVAPNSDGPTHLIGHSMGGTQCIFAAYFGAAYVDSIVTIDPVAYIAEEIRTVDQVAEFVSHRMGKVRRNAQEHFKNKEEYETFMNKRFFSKTFDPKIRENFIKHGAVKEKDGSYRFKTTPDQQMISYYSALYTGLHDHTRKVLSMLNCPVLHVAGTVYDFNTEDAIKLAREALPRGSEVADIPDHGHLVAFEKPKETFEAIYPFVARTAKQATSRIDDVSKRRNFDREQRRNFFAQRINEIHDTYPQNKLYSKL